MTVQELVQRAKRAEEIENQLEDLETNTWVIDSIKFSNSCTLDGELVQQIFDRGLAEIKAALSYELDALLVDWSEE